MQFAVFACVFSSTMMSSDPPTVNVNPTVLAVDTRSGSSKRSALQYAQLRAISADPTDDDEWNLSTPIQRTAEDRAILKALADASEATSGKGVSLLRNVGLAVSTTSQSVARPPVFVPTVGCLAGRQQQPQQKVEESKTETSKQRDVVDADEVFEIIRNIQDPEHPLTLEQLGVVSRSQIKVKDILDLPEEERSKTPYSTLNVRFTPTIPHCSMATQIGLCLRVKLDRSLPARFKTTVSIEPGTHSSEKAINKQLADKERVCAALENKHLLGIVNRCIGNGMTGNMT